LFAGGAFFDGRATGHQLGLPLADQALGPFVNPVEMALPHAVCVVQRACAASYAGAMKNIWGPEICALPVATDLTADCRNPDAKITIEDKALEERVNSAYRAIALSIAAYEGSAEVNRFAAPIDRYLAGKAPLGAAAERGLALFNGKAGCSACHSLAIGPEGSGPLLTDFTYSNLGVPKNPANPWYEQQKFNPEGAEWIDRGLGATLGKDPVYVAYAAENMGAQKVPTLRNLTKRITPDTERAYMHNGYFKTLEGLVHFLNSRDRLPRCQEALTEAEALAAACWPAPEVEATMTRQIGDLGLSPEEEAELVAFLRTLDDD
ncbi:MAG: cytochrome c peroxidase, partial [Paracoccaceae bacterium]